MIKIITEENRWNEEVSKVEAVLADREKCTRPNVQIAAKKQKYLLYQILKGLYTAGIVTRSINRKDIDPEIGLDRCS